MRAALISMSLTLELCFLSLSDIYISRIITNVLCLYDV